MTTAEETDSGQGAKSINPFDESFDANTALHSSLEAFETALPTPRDRAIFRKSAPLNNVAACGTLLTAPFRILRPKAVMQPKVVLKAVKRPRADAMPSGNLAPENGVLKTMHAKATEKSGPLSLLERAVRSRCRVRVVLRETHEVRGDVCGFVVAFDRHFNMVLIRAVIRDNGQNDRMVNQLFLRGENVVLVSLL